MRMKKVLIISISAILLTAIIGTGVYAMVSDKIRREAPKKSWSKKLSEMPNGWIKINSLMRDFEQQYNKSEDELTSRYDYMSFLLHYGSRHKVETSWNSRLYCLQDFNEVCPIELIKKIDREHICVVYKISHNEVGDVLAYVVFERQTAFLTKKDGVESAGFYEKWEKTGEFYLLTEKLSSADFENIEVGDPALDVSNIEPAILAEFHLFTFGYGHDDSKIYIETYRLLTDGIMHILFEAPKNAENGGLSPFSEFTVYSKTFYPYNSEAIPQIKTMINAPDILS